MIWNDEYKNLYSIQLNSKKKKKKKQEIQNNWLTDFKNNFFDMSFYKYF